MITTYSATVQLIRSSLGLTIRLLFHNHAPQQLPSGLAFHQQAADELGGVALGGAGEEGLGEGLGQRGAYGSRFGEVRGGVSSVEAAE